MRKRHSKDIEQADFGVNFLNWNITKIPFQERQHAKLADKHNKKKKKILESANIKNPLNLPGFYEDCAWWLVQT